MKSDFTGRLQIAPYITPVLYTEESNGWNQSRLIIIPRFVSANSGVKIGCLQDHLMIETFSIFLHHKYQQMYFHQHAYVPILSNSVQSQDADTSQKLEISNQA